MFKKIALSSAVFAIAFLAAAIGLGATPSSASHPWNNYHWARTSNTFTLRVHDNLTAKWEPYLTEADADWDKSAVLDLNVIWNSPLSSVKRCNSATGLIEVCNSAYGNTGWLGVAGIWVSGSHITKAYTKVNDTYFNQAPYNTPSWMRLVMCQEIGHDFGLDHQDETFNNANLGSCMDYTNDPDGGAGGASSTDPSNEHPNAHDYEQIATTYTHTDSTTTISSTAPTASRGNSEVGLGLAPGLDEHGLPPHARPGNGDVYVTDLGNDNKLIVHVFWIPAGRPGVTP